jgi:hypothetical protein
VPSTADFVSISCGAVASPQDWLDSITLNDAAGAQQPTVTFTELPFLRCNWTAVYWSTTYVPQLTWTAIGSLTLPPAEPVTTPKQLRLAFMDDVTSMAIAWTTGGPLTAPQSVRYGAARGPLSMSAPAVTATYGPSDLCGAPANVTSQVTWRDPGFLHKALMTNLAPGATYQYQVGSAADGWSTVRQFTAAPPLGTPVRWAAYGDQSIDEAAVNSSALVAAAADVGEAQFLLINGDLGYAIGIGYIWDQYLTLTEATMSTIPTQIQLGNHEA